MNQASRVFIFDETSTSRYDVTSAKEFGELVYMFPRGKARAGIFTEEFGVDVSKRLMELQYSPADDYICVSGSFAPVLMLALNVFERYECINLLVFNSVHGSYIPKTFKRRTEVCHKH